MPPQDMTDGYESKYWFEDRRRRRYDTFPPFTASAVYVGLQEDAKIEHRAKYKYGKPVLFVKSILKADALLARQLLSEHYFRKFGCDHINLGFSGSAKARRHCGLYVGT